MGYNITHLPQFQTVAITAEGVLNEEIRKEIFITAAFELNKAGYRRLLIDVVQAVIAPEEPLTGALALVSFMKQLSLPKHTKMALFYKNEAEHRKFFESAAQMEGFDLQYFMDRDEAIAWLTQE